MNITDVSQSGLSSSEILISREKFGSNELSPPRRASIWKQYLEKYQDPIIRILLIAIVLSAVVALTEGKSLLETAGITIAVILATTIAFFTEFKSNKEFDTLNVMREDTLIKVIRDGKPAGIPMREIVVGDLIHLEAGDLVPADGSLIGLSGLEVDESAFTGENEPVRKRINDTVYKGSFVTSGLASMIALCVGNNTKMGEIAASLTEGTKPQTPLQLKLDNLAGLISKFGYCMAGLIIAFIIIGAYLSPAPPSTPLAVFDLILGAVMYAVVIIVVCVPEGLPVSVTVSLALSMRKMTRAKSLVRRLIACETVGAVTVICTDKTGTLTKNIMEVAKSSIDPIIEPSIPTTSAGWITLNAIVNGTADLDMSKNRMSTIGDSTEGALLRFVTRNGISYREIREKFPPISQELFTSLTKQMSTVITINGRYFILLKGAPDRIANRCDNTQDLLKIRDLASQAMRTLAFAHGELDSPESIPNHLIWDGYVGIRDEIRPDVSKAVKSCHDAGIDVKMLTGDSPETATAIAKEVGILTTGKVITGKEFRDFSDDYRKIIAPEISVMARSEPTDKLLLVKALQANGEVVGVTGDGTNDAPALKSADVGLSMGIAGTEVAREASDIILLDDSFSTIERAVWWGRALYENIQRFLVFQLTINISAAFISVLSPVLGYPQPFTIIQLLWINVIMDSLAALALCSESPHPALMQKKPVPRSAKILTQYMTIAVLLTASVFILVGVLVLTNLIPIIIGPKAMTLFFAGFVMVCVWNGINCRGINGVMPPLFSGNPVFFLIMGAVVLVQIVIVQFGGDIFGTVPLSIKEWLLVILGTMPVLLLWPVLRFITRITTNRITTNPNN